MFFKFTWEGERDFLDKNSQNETFPSPKNVNDNRITDNILQKHQNLIKKLLKLFFF